MSLNEAQRNKITEEIKPFYLDDIEKVKSVTSLQNEISSLKRVQKTHKTKPHPFLSELEDYNIHLISEVIKISFGIAVFIEEVEGFIFEQINQKIHATAERLKVKAFDCGWLYDNNKSFNGGVLIQPPSFFSAMSDKTVFVPRAKSKDDSHTQAILRDFNNKEGKLKNLWLGKASTDQAMDYLKEILKKNPKKYSETKDYAELDSIKYDIPPQLTSPSNSDTSSSEDKSTKFSSIVDNDIDDANFNSVIFGKMSKAAELRPKKEFKDIAPKKADKFRDIGAPIEKSAFKIFERKESVSVSK